MEPIEKPAETRFPIQQLLRERWSPVAFSPEPVSLATLGSLFEAARWTASCYNEQPWSFLVAGAEDETEFGRLLDCLVPANQEWAKNAPVLGVALANLQFARNGKPNRHAYYDTGAAMAQLTVQATELGLRVHQMGGFDQDAVRKTYGLPSEWDSVAAFALGRPGDPSGLSESLRKREEAPRERKALGEIVFGGRFGEAFPLE